MWLTGKYGSNEAEMWPEMDAQMWPQDQNAKLKCGFVEMCIDYWVTQCGREPECKAQMWLC